MSAYPLFSPPLEELAEVLGPAIAANYSKSSVNVTECPDLRHAPYHLATRGLSGNERVADVGGPPHLVPQPRLDKRYSLISLAQSMEMDATKGQLIGAGAGPFHVIGHNTELSPNLSWQNGFGNVHNRTYYTEVTHSGGQATTNCTRSPSTDCALMVNLYGSSGESGPVLKISASGRTGQYKSFTECVRSALHEKYGNDRQVSLGGVFVIKAGKAYFHVMPDFPPASDLPFKDRQQAEEWLTYHDFEGPIVCLTVFHSADPQGLDLRLEHTHCFSVDGDRSRGGHYHYDLDGEDIEYEAYFNVAKTLYRIDQPN